ncbi:BolA family transcriptional regulator [bacterium]|nr:BolA family transcriptional regulator [bacterium]
MTIQLDAIETALQHALMPRVLVVQDDSHEHASHYVGNGVSHISIQIEAPGLDGLSRLERTRVIMGVLRPFLAQGLHAVRLIPLS